MVNEAEFPFARSLGDSIWLQDRFFEPGTDSSIGIASIRSLPVHVDRFQTANKSQSSHPRRRGSMKQFFRSWQTSAIMPSKQNNVCPCEYAHETERWDLPVLKFSWQGESGAWRGEGGSPRKKCQFAGSKRMVLVYNVRPGESKRKSRTIGPCQPGSAQTGPVCAGRPGL